jgi:hypothetical protein
MSDTFMELIIILTKRINQNNIFKKEILKN